MLARLPGVINGADIVKIPTKLKQLTAGDGDVILILCPGYWGKGATPELAVKAMPYSLDPKWIAYSVHPSTEVDGCGGMFRDHGTHPAVELARSF